MIKRELKWSKRALKQFDQTIDYISENSFQNAASFHIAVDRLLQRLLTHPEIYPPDKQKKNNDGSYRSFDIHSFKISYRVKSTAINVIRIRHVKMNPSDY